MAGHAVPMQTQAVPVVVFNPAQQNVSLAPRQKVEYSKKNINAVRGLTITQLALGIIIFILHVATTIINEEVVNELNSNGKIFDYNTFWHDFVDHAATGIWIGLLVIIAAAIGICGYKLQKRGLIVTHLVLNVFILLALIALIATTSANIGYIRDCRRSGESFYRNNPNDDYYGWRRNRILSTTTTPKPYIIFGEKLEGYSGDYYCKHALFTVWIAFDAILLVCSIILLFLTLTLMIYNSIAACICCREPGCCGSCCYSSPGNYSVPVVTYYSQPGGPVALPPNMQMVAQPQGTTSPYPQPVTVYHQPGYHPVLPTSIPYQQPVLTAVTTNPAQPANVHVPHPTVVTQATVAANSEAKWEELPPEYAEAVRNDQRQ